MERQHHSVQSALTKQVAHDVASKESGLSELSLRLDMLEAAFGNRLDALESVRLDQQLVTVDQQQVPQALPCWSPGRLMRSSNASDSREHSLSGAPLQQDSVAGLRHDILDLSGRLRDGFRIIDARCDQLEDLVNDCASSPADEYVSVSGPSQQKQSRQRQDSAGLIQKQTQKKKRWQRQQQLELVQNEAQEHERQDHQTSEILRSGPLLSGSLSRWSHAAHHKMANSSTQELYHV